MIKITTVSALLFFLAGFLLVPSVRAEINVVELDKPASMPAFSLEDHKGQSFTPKQLEGRWSLAMLGFTHCPDVCPFTLNNLEAVIAQMSLRVSPRSLPQVIFVGVDPKRDKPVLGEYVGHFHPNFIGVTGSDKELAKIVKGFDGMVRIGRPDKEGNYDVGHSASVVVIGPKGRLHAKLAPPLKPGEVAEYLARMQIKYRKNPG